MGMCSDKQKKEGRGTKTEEGKRSDNSGRKRDGSRGKESLGVASYPSIQDVIRRNKSRRQGAEAKGSSP